MKILFKLLLITLAFGLVVPVATAADVTLPHKFMSGTKAKAAQVNANFNAVKTGVDDNNSRVTAIETQTSNMETGCLSGFYIRQIAADGTINCEEDTHQNARVTALETQTSNMETGCSPGWSIRQIALDGTITCEQDTDTDTNTTYFAGTGISLSGTTFRVAPGVLSVAAHAYESENTSIDQNMDCVLRKAAGVGYAYFLPVAGATAASCDAVAGVQLPDEVTLTGLYCTVYDNSASNAIRGDLYRINMVTGISDSVYTTADSVDVNDEQVVNDTLPNAVGRNIVNNATYSYYLIFNYSTNDFSTLGVLGRFYGCRIPYTP